MATHLSIPGHRVTSPRKEQPVDVAAWAWAAPVAALAVVTVAEARLAGRRRPDGTGTGTGTRAAGAWAGAYVSLAVLFGIAAPGNLAFGRL